MKWTSLNMEDISVQWTLFISQYSCSEKLSNISECLVEICETMLLEDRICFLNWSEKYLTFLFIIQTIQIKMVKY